MRRVSVMAAFLAGALIIGSLTLPAGAKTVSQEDWDKQESVHVTAAPTGKAKEVEVEVILRWDGTAPIRDKSTLTDIRNTEGDEEYTKLPDGTLSWDNQGEDIHYKGNAAPETLPMEITVTYTLDGAEIAPEALAGKSGHLTMRFDYKNRLARTVEVDKKSYTVPVPLMAMTLVPLDEDVFSNVKVTNGKILSLDDSGMALGMEADDLWFDPLFLVVKGMQDKQMDVLNAIKLFSDEGLKSTGGLSNNSNGAPKNVRPIMDSALVAMAMMQGLTSAIVNPNDLRLMETIKSCDIFKNNELYSDSYLDA